MRPFASFQLSFETKRCTGSRLGSHLFDWIFYTIFLQFDFYFHFIISTHIPLISFHNMLCIFASLDFSIFDKAKAAPGPESSSSRRLILLLRFISLETNCPPAHRTQPLAHSIYFFLVQLQRTFGRSSVLVLCVCVFLVLHAVVGLCDKFFNLCYVAFYRKASASQFYFFLCFLSASICWSKKKT